MNTRTEYAPTANTPSNASRPPRRRVAVNPARMAIRMSGTNAAERRIADRFALLYSSERDRTRSSSNVSLVNDCIVAIPVKSFSSSAFNCPAVARTSRYRTSSFFWYRKDPQRIMGIGSTANSAISHERYKNTAPTTITVVVTCKRSFAPLSRNRSSWLTSSFIIASKSPF